MSAGDRLRAALHMVSATFGTIGAQVRVDGLGSEAWASVTFSGARHRFRITIQGPGAVGAAADFLEALPELDFDVPGHIVADIALVAEERSDGGDHAMLELEALTIEDC